MTILFSFSTRKHNNVNWTINIHLLNWNSFDSLLRFPHFSKENQSMKSQFTNQHKSGKIPFKVKYTQSNEFYPAGIWVCSLARCVGALCNLRPHWVLTDPGKTRFQEIDYNHKLGRTKNLTTAILILERIFSTQHAQPLWSLRPISLSSKYVSHSL